MFVYVVYVFSAIYALRVHRLHVALLHTFHEGSSDTRYRVFIPALEVLMHCICVTTDVVNLLCDMLCHRCRCINHSIGAGA